MADLVEHRPSRGLRGPQLRELWRHRHLVGAFARRDVTSRYRQAVLGIAWAGLVPLAGAAVFALAFSRVEGIDTGEVPYLVFAYAGWVGWTYFAGALQNAAGSLVRNASLVTKVWFPRLAAPVASLLPGLVDLAVALVVAVPLCLAAGVAPGASVLYLPLAVPLLAAGALGAGLALGALHVRYRDVGHLLALLVQLWLFASPVAYPVTAVDEAWRTAYALNPAVGGIELLRAGLVGTPVDGTLVAASVAGAAALLAVGLVVFASGERRFADVI